MSSIRSKALAFGLFSFTAIGDGGSSNQDPSMQFRLTKENSLYYDKNRDRTGFIVRDGHLSFASVDEQLNNDPNSPFTTVQIDFFLAPLIGDPADSAERIELQKMILTPEFLQTIITNKKITSNSFDAEYLGEEDRTTKVGITYPKCWILKFTNIKYVPKPVNPNESSTLALLTDLEVTVAKAKEGVPYLGIVQFDFTGYFRGIPFTVGVDYMPDGPAAEEKQRSWFDIFSMARN